MKTLFSLLATFLLFSQVSALAFNSRAETARDIIETRSAETCGEPLHTVEFSRAVLPGDDHFYTTDASERQNAVTYLGYHEAGTAAHVFTTQEPSTLPLYRLDYTKNADHFYITSSTERDNAVTYLGYRDEGTAAYVYTNQICGSVPLYRLYNGAIVDHFYTTSASESNDAQAHSGYQYEGIAAYVLPA